MRQVSAALIGGRAEPDELSDGWIVFFPLQEVVPKGAIKPKNPTVNHRLTARVEDLRCREQEASIGSVMDK